jgi:hypothetical protein
MRIPFWWRLAFSSTMALLACLFVVAYNHVGLMLATKGQMPPAVALAFLKLQMIAFALPLAGYATALKMRKSPDYLWMVLLSQLVFLFAFAWPLIAILQWQIDRIEVVN